MYRGYVTSILLIISIVLFVFSQLYAQEHEDEIIIISERIGEVIDLEERNKFNFFLSVKEFQSAVLLKFPDGNYIWKITYVDSTTDNKLITTPFLFIAATDSRHYVDIAENVYRYIPLVLRQEDLNRIHGINERITLDNYLQMVKF